MWRRVVPLLLLMPAVACAAAPARAGWPAAVPLHGLAPDPALPRPRFVLTDTSGAAFDFAARTHGRPTLLYFGYTSCPDDCGTAMSTIAAALRRVPPALREVVRVVFVTTDPARDTAPVLRRWLDRFSPGLIGLRGTAAQVARAQQASGIEAGHAEPSTPGQPPGPLRYAVQHSALIFAYDVQDRLPVVYPGGVAPSDIAIDLPALARRTP